MSGVLPNFVPVVDRDMVPQHPRSSIASGASRNHDLLAGFTQHDGAGIIYLNPLGQTTSSNLSHFPKVSISPRLLQCCLIVRFNTGAQSHVKQVFISAVMNTKAVSLTVSAHTRDVDQMHILMQTPNKKTPP